MSKMAEDQLLSQIEQLERQAVGYYTGEIAKEQAIALDYYLGKPLGTEEIGRSAVVSSDVWDVVEGMTPMVLKPFVSSDDVVKFNPIGADDEKQATQESTYINWIATQRNDSFNELVAAVKTGLLQKNGIAKYWWEKSNKTSIERYFGISDDEFAILAQPDGENKIEVTEHTEIPGAPTFGPDGRMVLGESTHDVTLRIREEVGVAKYRCIPPEEFLISKDATSTNPKLARFVEHRCKKTISEIREMGYDVEDEIADAATEDTYYSQQYLARRSDEENATGMNEMLDPSSREVMFREVYIQVDFDGDGYTELRKVCIVGHKVLCNEETEEVPFVAWSPYPQPFKFYGRCPADETVEIQKIKSTLWRQSLDNIYTINNNRVFANKDVNLDDLLDNQIAGVVRIDSNAPVNSAVAALPITPIGAVVQPMIEYLDSAKENRTGFTRYNQGSDSDSLNKTATGIRLIQQSANGRIEIISRAFAEQFLAPLMLGLHGLCRRHATKAETIRLTGDWVIVDPRSWITREDMTVAVGLGNADQQLQMQGIQLLIQAQHATLQAGMGGVTPQNIYEANSALAGVVGRKNPDQFFTAPDKMPPPSPPPEDPKLHFMAADLEIKDKQFQLDAQRFELEKRKVDILNRDSLVKADVNEATVALQAKLQGVNMDKAVADAVNGIRDQLHQERMDLYQHQLQIAQHKLAAQDQAHQQALSIAQHEAQEAKTQAEGQGKEDKGTELMGALVQHLSAPKKVVRDGSGRVVGLENVVVEKKDAE